MIYGIITIGAYLSWWRLTTAWNLSSTSTRMVTAFLLTTWQILVVMVIAGLFGLVNYWAIIAVNLFLLILLHSIIYQIQPSWSLLREDVQNILTHVYEAWDSQLTTMVFLLTMILMGMSIWYAVTMPPMAYDYYHLVKAALIVQDGHIQPFGWDNRGVDYYPANVEAIFAYVLLGTRNMSIVCLVQWVFGLVLSLSIYRICRNFGVSIAFSAVSGMLLWSSTVVFHESWMALNDLAVTAMIGMGWMYLTERRLGWVPVVLSSLAFGYALGSKASTIYWFAGAALYLIWRLLSDNNQEIKNR